MEEEFYEYAPEEHDYPCDISGVCAGTDCSHYPVCAGWKKGENDAEGKNT